LNSQAQLVNIESQRVQSDSVRTITVLDLLYNYQNNNNEELSLINFSATHQYKTKDLKNKESIEFELQIPMIQYQPSQYYYDTNAQQYLLFLTNNTEFVTYETFKIKCVGSPVVIMHLFKGHILRLGTYDSDNNTFNIDQTHRGVAVQKMNFNWLEILHEYSIGERIVKIEGSETGIVTSISDNNYEITAIIEGTSVPIILKQYELAPYIVF
jgi:hypothetical protein